MFRHDDVSVGTHGRERQHRDGDGRNEAERE